ncbi:hypothetical protein DOTSEDRAFT_72891 [Lecanosticta acicola]|uniref:CENP-V/GFA domain-containing protein n=1 Tax=Lecanosticta acicola TaxID=111012 RepID=A0AAI8W1K9_9PEZI|nr:hypothetical protein DOTSEDRAFT_72891 [Lecanosticta acicola]
MAPSFEGNPSDQDPSTLNNGMKGSCLCGNITIHINQEGLFDKPNGHVCHCFNCRRFAGSSHVNILALPTKNVTVVDPKSYLKTYQDEDTGNGNVVPRSFCSNCGSAVGVFPAVVPELSMVALGLFPRMPEPEFEVFTKHRQEWEGPVTERTRQCAFAEEFKEFVPGILKQ